MHQPVVTTNRRSLAHVPASGHNKPPKEAFAAAMKSWRQRCEKCVRLQSDYVDK